MAMVPELTVLDAERVKLNSARYAFTVISNVAVFVLLYIFINTMTVSIKLQFEYLALSVLGVGGLCSFFFLLLTRERIKSQYDSLLDHVDVSALPGSPATAAAASPALQKVCIPLLVIVFYFRHLLIWLIFLLCLLVKHIAIVFIYQ